MSPLVPLVEMTMTGNVEQLMQRLDPAVLQAGEMGAMLEAVEYVHDQVYRDWPVGVSEEHTRDRFFTGIGGTPVDLTGLVASPDIAARVIEMGRTPGAKMPPSSALEDWVGDKLGDGRLAFVVARAIGRQGIAPRYVFQAVSERVGPAVSAIFSKHVAESL